MQARRTTKAKIPYRRSELFAVGKPKPLSGKHLDQVAFPLGGIGTGCISLSGRGALINWEIFNRPNRGYRPDYSYFSIWARKANSKPVFRILEERLAPPYTPPEFGNPLRNLCGPLAQYGSGLPRMESCEFTGEYPLAKIKFRDRKLPLSVKLEAFNPFIPLNDNDSSLPAAILFWTLENRTKSPVQATVAFNLENRCGHPEVGGNRNEFIREKNFRGLKMTTEKYKPDSPYYGSMALVTPLKNVTHQTQWAHMTDALFTPQIHFLETFAATGQFDNDPSMEATADDGSGTGLLKGESCIGSLGLPVLLEPGESVRLPFIITWHFPWYVFGTDMDAGTIVDEQCPMPESIPPWKNHYATLYDDAWDVASYVTENLTRLERQTRTYRDALFSSTLPTHVLDAVAATSSVLKTPTCIRLTDGTLYGWEGCGSDRVFGRGSCTHVWHFAQTAAYLFPELERSMRDAEYKYGLSEEDGHMVYRLPLPLESAADHAPHLAAADGQLGGVMRVYRDWQISGDDKWLKSIWPKVKKSLEYAWKIWDKDKDGLLEGPHMATFDYEFRAPEAMCGTLYLGALRAGEEMARYLGETDKADEYRRLFEIGSANTDQQLFNGEYYQQLIDPDTDEPYQYARGCLITQLIGQWVAGMIGLGHVVKPENVSRALASIYKYNFHANVYELQNPGLTFAVNDDKGTTILSWPKGGRPRTPTPYYFDTQPGYEHMVGSHMIYEGLLEQGLTICKAVRDRHDGHRRNPWDEIESHYGSRSLASWSYLLGLAGFSYSAPRRYMKWAPKINADNFRCFFSVGSGWGVFSQKSTAKGHQVRLEVLYGRLVLRSLELGSMVRGKKIKRAVVRLAGKQRTCKMELSDSGTTLSFSDGLTIKQDQTLNIRLEKA